MLSLGKKELCRSEKVNALSAIEIAVWVVPAYHMNVLLSRRANQCIFVSINWMHKLTE